MGYEKPSITAVGSVADLTQWFNWPPRKGGNKGGGGHGGVS